MRDLDAPLTCFFVFLIWTLYTVGDLYLRLIFFLVFLKVCFRWALRCLDVRFAIPLDFLMGCSRSLVGLDLRLVLLLGFLIWRLRCALGYLRLTLFRMRLPGGLENLDTRLVFILGFLIVCFRCTLVSLDLDLVRFLGVLTMCLPRDLGALNLRWTRFLRVLTAFVLPFAKVPVLYLVLTFVFLIIRSLCLFAAFLLACILRFGFRSLRCL